MKITKAEHAHWNKLANDPHNKRGRLRYWNKLAKKYGYYPLMMTINQDGEIGGTPLLHKAKKVSRKNVEAYQLGGVYQGFTPKKGDKLKIHVYPKPKVNSDNIMLLGKVPEPSGKPIKKDKSLIALILSRKDAQALKNMFDYGNETSALGKRILNKLKREGIK